MAEGQMMTAADVVAELMGGEHGDLLRDAIALVCREVMDAEISAEVGAGRQRIARGSGPCELRRASVRRAGRPRRRCASAGG